MALMAKTGVQTPSNESADEASAIIGPHCRVSEYCKLKVFFLVFNG